MPQKEWEKVQPDFRGAARWKAEALQAAGTGKETHTKSPPAAEAPGELHKEKVNNPRRKGRTWKRNIKAGMSWGSQLRGAAVLNMSLTARPKPRTHLQGMEPVGPGSRRILVLEEQETAISGLAEL